MPPPRGPAPAHQRVPLHVLAPRELLPADLAGVGPLARVGAHVPLEDALVHGREAAVGAAELLPDDRELVHCKIGGGRSACGPCTARPPPALGCPRGAGGPEPPVRPGPEQRRLLPRSKKARFSDQPVPPVSAPKTHECTRGINRNRSTDPSPPRPRVRMAAARAGVPPGGHGPARGHQPLMRSKRPASLSLPMFQGVIPWAPGPGPHSRGLRGEVRGWGPWGQSRSARALGSSPRVTSFMLSPRGHHSDPLLSQGASIQDSDLRPPGLVIPSSPGLLGAPRCSRALRPG